MICVPCAIPPFGWPRRGFTQPAESSRAAPAACVLCGTVTKRHLRSSILCGGGNGRGAVPRSRFDVPPSVAQTAGGGVDAEADRPRATPALPGGRADGGAGALRMSDAGTRTTFLSHPGERAAMALLVGVGATRGTGRGMLSRDGVGKRL